MSAYDPLLFLAMHHAVYDLADATQRPAYRGAVGRSAWPVTILLSCSSLPKQRPVF